MAKHRKPSTAPRRLAAGAATAAVLAAPVFTATSANATPMDVLIQRGIDAAVANPQQVVANPAAVLDQVLGTVASDTSPVETVTKQAAPTIGDKIVEAARSQIGTPYVWGGSQPGGFDCSGLTSWAYSQVGKSIPRTSQAQASEGMAVSNPLPGDIVSFYSGASHVGIFSGNGMVVHSPQSGDVVKEVSMDYMPVHNIVRF